MKNTKLLDRRATEVLKRDAFLKLGRAWRCSLCGEIFVAFKYQSQSSDGEKPNCCPYCGQIFEHFTEYA